jgi:hypothetical protein
MSEQPNEDTTPPAAPPAEPSAEPNLGDAGQAAIKAERDRADRLERELKKREQEDEKRRKDAMSEQEKAIEAAKEAARAETTAEYEARILGLRIQARATNFHDPELVVGMLELPADAKDDEIDAALAKVAKERPYLTKGGSVPPMAQGPRGTQSSPDGSSNEDWLRNKVQAARNR